MGVSGRTGARGDLAVCEGVPAAIALVAEDGAIERATRGFLERFEAGDGSWASAPPEIELIATGQAERVAVAVDGAEAELVAVVDADGRRMAVVTVAASPSADEEPVSPLLEEPLDESPAIVWLKDLDGRYLRVNRRYVEQLGTDADSIRGCTDAELTAARSIEGLRLEEEDTAAGRELLELEYRIGAFEERPAFAVLRFALRDGDGQPTATCSVAAPVAEESLARSECERLMRIDRWARLEPLAIRQELLEEWGLALADGSSGPPLDRDERVAAVLVERDEALAAAAQLEQDLSREREELESLRAESERSGQRADELEGAVASGHARTEELEQSLVRAEARAGELETELTVIRAELDERLSAPDDASAAESTGPRWETGSQRALSAALVGLTEWRAVLKNAVATLGSEGGWDATIAWCPDRPRGPMTCAAIWARDEASLASFETRTWRHRRDASTAEFGRARNRMAATCLLELQAAEDPLLRAAAEEGMGTALLVPISDNGEPITMLELLSRTSTPPSAELMVSLDAIALQLGAIAQLLKLTDVPRWRTGRL